MTHYGLPANRHLRLVRKSFAYKREKDQSSLEYAHVSPWLLQKGREGSCSQKDCLAF